MINEESILKQVLKEKMDEARIQQEGSELMNNYFKTPKEDDGLRIANLQREINSIKSSQIDPEIEIQKKIILRQKVEEHQRQQKINNEMLQNSFSQNSSIAPSGKVIVGY